MAVVKQISIKSTSGSPETRDIAVDAANVDGLATAVAGMAAASATNDSNGNAITSYLKTASQSGNTLTLTSGGGSASTYTPDTFGGSTAGLVPASTSIAAADKANNYLNANGTWSEVSTGETYSNGTGINIDSNNAINLTTISGLTNGTYGDNTSAIADITAGNSATLNIPKFTVDAQGRITSASNKQITFRNDNTTYTNTAPITLTNGSFGLSIDSNTLQVSSNKLKAKNAVNNGTGVGAYGIVGITDKYDDITTQPGQAVAASAYALQMFYARLTGVQNGAIPIVVPTSANEASTEAGAIWIS